MKAIIFFVLLISNCRSLILESRSSSLQTLQGQVTTSVTKASIPTFSSQVFNELITFKNWGKWFTTSKIFTDYSTDKLQSKGDSFTEKFGLFDSSSITWTVSEVKANSKLSLYSSSMKVILFLDDFIQ